MPKVSALQDPVWTDSADLCVGCGYSLHGLAAPGRCPECGAAYGTGQLVLTGIVHRSRSISVGRRVAWIAVVTCAVLLSVFWAVLLILQVLLLIGLIAATLGGAIALWVTGPRERSGVERLVITPAGVARVALRANSERAKLDTLLTPFDGANSVEVTRVSPVWRRLRVRVVTKDASGKANVRQVFDAGFRCPDSHAPEVERVVREFLQAALAARAGGPTPATAAAPHREPPAEPEASGMTGGAESDQADTP